MRGVHATSKDKIRLKKEEKRSEIKKVCNLKKEYKIFFYFLSVQSLYVVELESSLRGPMYPNSALAKVSLYFL